jgi:putative hemolysin
VAKGRIRNAIKKRIRGKLSKSSGRSEKASSAASASKPSTGARRLKSVSKSAAVKVMRRIGTVKEAIRSLDAQLKLHRYKVREFQPKVKFEYKKGHFTVKTVTSGEELEEVLRLRFDVFVREYKNLKPREGVDVDKLDYICDHLIIRDDREGRIVGTYRLNSNRYADVYYSSSEFEFEHVLEGTGTVLELGRAAIDREYRTGAVISLLWRGIAQYVVAVDAEVMIGCASAKTMEPLEIGLFTHHLEAQGLLRYDLGIEPTKKYKVKTLPQVLSYIEKNPFEYDAKEIEARIPALMKSYFKMGFKAYGEPAIDRDFHCIDFFILMRVADLDDAFKRRYFNSNQDD